MPEHEHDIEVVTDRGSYFVVITTALIVVVMAVFTWVMWGMAKRVFLLTDVMLEFNTGFKSIVVTTNNMARDFSHMNGVIDAMGQDIGEMNAKMGNMDVNVATMAGEITAMNTNIGSMTTSIGGMQTDMAAMQGDMQYMSATIYYIGSTMTRMGYDVGQATSAFSSPMNYMFGNMMPF